MQTNTGGTPATPVSAMAMQNLGGGNASDVNERPRGAGDVGTGDQTPAADQTPT